MLKIYLILANVWARSGVAFQIAAKYPWDQWKCYARIGNEMLLAFVYQKKDKFLFLCENRNFFNKESQMPCAAILAAKLSRAYDRVKNIGYLATKQGRNMNFDQLNGDDHQMRHVFYNLP